VTYVEDDVEKLFKSRVLTFTAVFAAIASKEPEPSESPTGPSSRSPRTPFSGV
jgi:hypothetical protein